MSREHYDPDRHDTQLVAVFERRADAVGARDALLGAGLPAASVSLVDHAEGEHDAHEGFWESVRRLFAPREEADALGQALQRGHIMVVVAADDAAERETAIEVLEGYGPLDLDERPDAGHPLELNHMTLSRADMAELPRPAVPDAAPAAAPDPSDQPAGTSYTYGVPEHVARALTAEEQVMAQPPVGRIDAPHFVRIVEERVRVGWREQPEGARRVRSYLAPRQSDGNRVHLLEEDIDPATGTPRAS